MQSPLNRDLLLVLNGSVAMGSMRATGFENAYTYFVAKLHQVCVGGGGRGRGAQLGWDGEVERRWRLVAGG